MGSGGNGGKEQFTVTEQEIRRQVQEIIEQVANNETHLATIECADELAALATAEWMNFSRGRDSETDKLFKVAMALGYETLDMSVWDSALNDGIEL